VALRGADLVPAVPRLLEEAREVVHAPLRQAELGEREPLDLPRGEGLLSADALRREEGAHPLVARHHRGPEVRPRLEVQEGPPDRARRLEPPPLPLRFFPCEVTENRADARGEEERVARDDEDREDDEGDRERRADRDRRAAEPAARARLLDGPARREEGLDSAHDHRPEDHEPADDPDPERVPDELPDRDDLTELLPEELAEDGGDDRGDKDARDDPPPDQRELLPGRSERGRAGIAPGPRDDGPGILPAGDCGDREGEAREG